MKNITSTRQRTVVLLSAAAVAWISYSGPAQAALLPPVDAIDWNESYLLRSNGGIENPLVRFGFNPQPEPPAAFQLLETAHPPEPGRAAITVFGVENPQLFQVFFAIGLPGTALSVGSPVIPGGDFDTLSFDVFGPQSPGAGPPARLFEVELDFGSESGGIVDFFSARAFNPQPEPPAQFGPDSDFAMDFSFTALSSATVGLSVFDAQGNRLTLTQVSAPSVVWLFSSGLAMIAAGWLVRATARSRKR